MFITEPNQRLGHARAEPGGRPPEHRPTRGVFSGRASTYKGLSALIGQIMESKNRLADDNPGLTDSVDLLIERYGIEDAENRIIAALSLIRRKKAETCRGCS